MIFIVWTTCSLKTDKQPKADNGIWQRMQINNVCQTPAECSAFNALCRSDLPHRRRLKNESMQKETRTFQFLIFVFRFFKLFFADFWQICRCQRGCHSALICVVESTNFQVYNLNSYCFWCLHPADLVHYSLSLKFIVWFIVWISYSALSMHWPIETHHRKKASSWNNNDRSLLLNSSPIRIRTLQFGFKK